MKDKEGFHKVGMYLPEIVWEAVQREARRQGQSAYKVMSLILADHFKVPRDKIAKAEEGGSQPPNSQDEVTSPSFAGLRCQPGKRPAPEHVEFHAHSAADRPACR